MTATMTDPRALPLKDRIRWARQEAGFSQVAFAAALGTTQRHVSRWENGHHSPSGRYVALIAETTGQPESLFVDDDEEPV